MTEDVRIVVDLGPGDQTKGAETDYLAATEGITLNVRHNGAAQAAHNVVLDDGRHHTFQCYGSATFAGARTHLSRFMMADPFVILSEADDLATKGVDHPLRLISFDEDTLLTMPYHRWASEQWAQAHPSQSCGMGVWETTDYASKFPDAAIRASDLLSFPSLYDKALLMQRHYSAELGRKVGEDIYGICNSIKKLAKETAILNRASRNELFRSHDRIIFEGAQGVLLDQQRGFKPYITSSNTTDENAYALLREVFGQDLASINVTCVGVIRALASRHGAGPFPTEDASLKAVIHEDHNRDDGRQGIFRFGWFDIGMLNYALNIIGGVDVLAVSHLDQLEQLGRWRMALDRDDPLSEPVYREFSGEMDFLSAIAQQTLIAPTQIAHGPKRSDRKWIDLA